MRKEETSLINEYTSLAHTSQEYKPFILASAILTYVLYTDSDLNLYGFGLWAGMISLTLFLFLNRDK